MSNYVYPYLRSLMPFAMLLALATISTIPTAYGGTNTRRVKGRRVTVRPAVAHDISRPLGSLVESNRAVHGLVLADASGALASNAELGERGNQSPPAPITPPVITSPPGAAAVEQKSQGTRPAAQLIESFDGLGVGFEGPQGTANLRNPSDNSLAVGKDHIFQIVNSRMAIFTKKGKLFAKTGKVLYGP